MENQLCKTRNKFLDAAAALRVTGVGFNNGEIWTYEHGDIFRNVWHDVKIAYF